MFDERARLPVSVLVNPKGVHKLLEELLSSIKISNTDHSMKKQPLQKILAPGCPNTFVHTLYKVVK